MSGKLFAIFGDPVAHSKSPLMHNFAFEALGYPGCYTRYLLEEGAQLRDRFFSLQLGGANITVPHKEHAYRACDELDDFARSVGAVNTIVRKAGKLYGYNTDAPGFLKAIARFKEIRTVLLLGAGGTALSTAPILRDAGYEVSILNRSAPRLKAFAEAGFATFTFDTFEAQSYDMIVNMTSAGLKEETFPAPETLLKPLLKTSKAAVDVVYGKQTPFLRLAESLGVPTQDGSEMLLQQGVLAFDLFSEQRFDLETIEEAMRKGLRL